MADQIEQMGVLIETQQKVSVWRFVLYTLIHKFFFGLKLKFTRKNYVMQQSEDWRDKYDAQVHQCSDLSTKLSATEVSWVHLFFSVVLMFEWTLMNC